MTVSSEIEEKVQLPGIIFRPTTYDAAAAPSAGS